MSPKAASRAIRHGGVGKQSGREATRPTASRCSGGRGQGCHAMIVITDTLTGVVADGGVTGAGQDIA